MQEKADKIKRGEKIEERKAFTRWNDTLPLTVHLVPHSHQDLGWVKTMDEYFSGSNHFSQNAAVRDTLDTVVE